MAAQATPEGVTKDKAVETPKGAWKITFLLFLFMLVNFADKIVVGLAGGPIMDELKISPQQFGDLGSSFFYLFSASAIIVGFIVNRVPTRCVLLVMGLVWALAQFPMVDGRHRSVYRNPRPRKVCNLRLRLRRAGRIPPGLAASGKDYGNHLAERQRLSG